MPLRKGRPQQGTRAHEIRGEARSISPNGAVSQSLGLRGTSYPGSPSTKHPQPQRGCGPSHHTAARDVRHNPVGVDSNLSRSPKVGAAPTLGWWPQSLGDCSRPNAIRFHHTITSSRHPGIPTGFRPKAQGCEARATLGKRPKKITTPTGLWPTSHDRETKAELPQPRCG